ncbi:MAG TPA: AAA family ATPase [Candidatus Angelobacter sp.]|jgi:DNA repair protein RecN (Recombination protein N)|nr:AAA family ATPase [Candidatus Angelobacter sp.]
MPLVELRIANLAVVRSARLEFGPGGLAALTGETGAGKTVCIAALRLVLGGRFDPELVRAGCDAGSVAAVFEGVPDEVRERLDALGVPDDDLLTLSRELPRGGRGASRVNGALVSASTLREIGEALVEVTGQGESHRLLRAGRQRDLLDAFGGTPLLVLRTSTAAAVRRWRDAEEALARAAEQAAVGAAELDRARDLVADLQPLDLRPGEDDELAAERLRLRHAAALAAAAEAVHAASQGEDDALGAADLLAAAAEQGRALRGVDPGVDELVAGASDLVERVRDLAATARRTADGFVLDGGRLAAVEERLDVLDRLKRRHGGSIAAALEALEDAAALCAMADAGTGGLERLRAEVEASRAEAAEVAGRLSDGRSRAAARLEKEATTRLRQLRLPHGRLRIVLTRAADPGGLPLDGSTVACSAAGVDEVEFRLATARDGVPLPLAQGPSGGELSRLALALRAVVAVAGDSPTLVLDEVDTGVGGETAARVGEVLAAIGEQRQVIAITHRAEIAARAAWHLRVVKDERAGRPETTVAVVDGEERVAEMARLMSGRGTEAALARARELIEEGRVRPDAASTRTIAPR